MAAVAVVLICMTIPPGRLHRRRLMRCSTLRHRRTRPRARPLPLGKWRWVAGAVVTRSTKPLVTIVVPLLGVLLRAASCPTGAWACRCSTYFHGRVPHGVLAANLMRAIVNSVAIGVFGGALLAVITTPSSAWPCTAKPGQRHALHGLQRAGAARRAPGTCWRAWRSCGCSCSSADVAGQRARRRPGRDGCRACNSPTGRARTSSNGWVDARLHLQRVAGFHGGGVDESYGLRLISSTPLQVGPRTGRSRPQRRRATPRPVRASAVYWPSTG